MLERADNEWDYVAWRQEAKIIAKTALDSRGEHAADQAKKIIDYYVRRGELGFRDLVARRHT